MTWTNKDKTRWVDLDKISYFDYTKELDCDGSTLTLAVDGYEVFFGNDDADAIYEILSNRKSML